MKAFAHSLRIAPKKANLIAQLVRGMPVPAAMEALRKTHKKGARMVELLLRSAIANTSHNDKQDPQTMVISSIVVNQGQSYRRGMPMARGRTRPFRKFLSHITLELGFAGDVKVPKVTRGASGIAKKESAPSASHKPKTAATMKKKAKTSSASPASSSSPVSSK